MSPEKRQQYFDRELPYRVNLLMAIDLIEVKRERFPNDECLMHWLTNGLVLEPAYEISIIIGRALLQFLGLTWSKKIDSIVPYESKNEDINIKSLYPEKEHCPLDDEIIIEYKKSICMLMKHANKAVAHITSTEISEEEQAMLKEARKAIYILVLKHIPDINKTGEKGKTGIWYYEQVDMKHTKT